MRHIRHNRGSWVAFIAASVLMLQSFLAACGAHAAPTGPMLDAAGNPLCITSTENHDTAPAGEHSKLLHCCLAECSGASAALADQANAGSAIFLPKIQSGNPFAAHKMDHIRVLDHNPGSPRAPPSA